MDQQFPKSASSNSPEVAKNLEVKCFTGRHYIPSFLAKTHNIAFAFYNLLFLLMLEQSSSPGGDKTHLNDNSLNGTKNKQMFR